MARGSWMFSTNNFHLANCLKSSGLKPQPSSPDGRFKPPLRTDGAPDEVIRRKHPTSLWPLHYPHHMPGTAARPLDQ